jgi:uncharacterized damage-inducible protein DinB
MALNNALLGELKYETSLTRKILERVPMDKKDWKPHEKSMTLGRLATHIVETIHWIPVILGADAFDFNTNPSPRGRTAASSEELLSILDQNLEEATRALTAADDVKLNSNWQVRRGEQVVMSSPKKKWLSGDGPLVTSFITADN